MTSLDLTGLDLLTAVLGESAMAEITASEPEPEPEPAPEVPKLARATDQLTHAAQLMALRPDLRFVQGLGWFQWDGARWAPDAEPALRAAVYEHARDYITGMAKPSDFAKELASRQGLDDVAKICRSVPGTMIAASGLDDCQNRLHAAGTTFSLETGESWPTAPDELNTQAAAVLPAPGTCPRWLQFLEECFPGDPDTVGYLQALIGYGLTGLGTEHLFVVLQGGGANGKSTFIKAITHALKQYVVDLPVRVLTAARSNDSGESPTPQLMRLRGARLVFTSESDREDRLNEALVKQITGNDYITARHLYGEPVTFPQRGLVFMATNYLPEIRGQDSGIWRRVKVIEWRESFKDRMDKTLDRTLESEAAGILAWALEGALAYRRDGLAQPDRVTQSVETYRGDSDALVGFFPGVIESDPSGFISRGDLSDLWVAWHQSEGIHERDAWKMPTLYKALRVRGVEEHKTDGVRGFKLRVARKLP